MNERHGKPAEFMHSESWLLLALRCNSVDRHFFIGLPFDRFPRTDVIERFG